MHLKHVTVRQCHSFLTPFSVHDSQLAKVKDNQISKLRQTIDRFQQLADELPQDSAFANAVASIRSQIGTSLMKMSTVRNGMNKDNYHREAGKKFGSIARQLLRVASEDIRNAVQRDLSDYHSFSKKTVLDQTLQTLMHAHPVSRASVSAHLEGSSNLENKFVIDQLSNFAFAFQVDHYKLAEDSDERRVAIQACESLLASIKEFNLSNGDRKKMKTQLQNTLNLLQSPPQATNHQDNTSNFVRSARVIYRETYDTVNKSISNGAGSGIKQVLDTFDNPCVMNDN